MAFDLGIYHFGELSTHAPPKPGRRIQELIEQATAADKAGLEVFAVGEHYRSDYAVSRPAVALAPMTENTRNMVLSSAVTVLSSDDPVRFPTVRHPGPDLRWPPDSLLSSAHVAAEVLGASRPQPEQPVMSAWRRSTETLKGSLC
jgi:hypothetical protein